MSDQLCTGAVAIGRNEGIRLRECLASIPACVKKTVYVDSGSTDNSPEAAERLGAHVVRLDSSKPFTAARARNAGFATLDYLERWEFVQFIDADTILAPGWIETAVAFMQQNPRVAVVCGRLRERYPERSVYIRLAAKEWEIPSGLIAASGGVALMRAKAFREVGGFDPSVIAGEDTEICARLRDRGWEIHGLCAEMAVHDIGMMRFTQWWKRSRRGGYAAAQGAAMHGSVCQRLQQLRALLWGLGLPVGVVAGMAITPWASAMLLSLPAQVLRLALREGIWLRASWEWAVFNTVAKTPEALGVVEYHLRRLAGKPAGIFEYR